MYPIHPIVALDLARERSREHARAAAQWRLASLAAPDATPAGQRPSGAPGQPGGFRRAIASVLRTVAAASARLAGSAGRVAARLEGGPA